MFALIGATGVGKTTSTAKIAAAFATKHGAGNLGLITLDAYRVGAQEQLRAYGRILGVPVHTAHDRASLEDLLDLLSAKKMVLIDTAGMAQRDARTRELLDMLSHRSIQKLLVVNAAAQGETIEDVMISYRAATCRGVVLSKIDEAVKLGPALDAVIRHKLKVIGVANGQRVPEDWHRLSAQALVQRALRAHATPSWKLDAGEVSLVFAGRTRCRRWRPQRCGAPRLSLATASAARTSRPARSSPTASAPRTAVRPGRRPAPAVRRAAAAFRRRWSPTPRWRSPAWCSSGWPVPAAQPAGTRWWSTPRPARRAPPELAALDLAAGIEPLGAGPGLPGRARPAAAPRQHPRLQCQLPQRAAPTPPRWPTWSSCTPRRPTSAACSPAARCARCCSRPTTRPA